MSRNGGSPLTDISRHHGGLGGSPLTDISRHHGGLGGSPLTDISRHRGGLGGSPLTDISRHHGIGGGGSPHTNISHQSSDRCNGNSGLTVGEYAEMGGGGTPSSSPFYANKRAFEVARSASPADVRVMCMTSESGDVIISP